MVAVVAHTEPIDTFVDKHSAPQVKCKHLDTDYLLKERLEAEMNSSSADENEQEDELEEFKIVDEEETMVPLKQSQGQVGDFYSYFIYFSSNFLLLFMLMFFMILFIFYIYIVYPDMFFWNGCLKYAK